MRILLVQAYLGGGEPPVYPLGLACLAAVLPDHAVRVFDPNVAADPLGDLARAVAEHAPEVVGLSLRNIDSTNKRRVNFYYARVRPMLDTILCHAPARPVLVIGGSGFSMFAAKIMADEPRWDLGVPLEGEAVFPLLLDRLDRPETVPGVYYRRDGQVRQTPGAAPPADLNALPPPDRARVPVAPYRNMPEAVGIETKRGCALHCVYCIYGFLNGRRLRLRDPARIVDEVEALAGQLDCPRFTFVDSVFNVPLDHAAAVCREIVRRGLQVEWSAWFHEKHMPPDFVGLARQAGCRKFILSPDGFSDHTLARLGKGYARRDVLRTYATLSRVPGIEICYNFFKNPPGQTLGNALDLLWFYARAKRQLRRRVHFEFSVLRVEPHTELHRVALEEKMVDPGDDLLYPRFYSQLRTRYIETFFNLMQRVKGQ